jgi:mitochondrial fission protein ELM1
MVSRRPDPAPAPFRIVLDARPGLRPSPKPPVVIFLGSEAAQQRAERVFCWSVETARDPARRYEIHVMRDLAGFRSRRWTTGFSNYRFAVPAFAGAVGKAIYNDVDQVYLADPGDLFDEDLAGAGYLARSPQDTSVMLLDCARMRRIWTPTAARRRSKTYLTRRAAGNPGLFGALDPSWNAREREYAAGRTRCLHFTTLKTQPWRPFPDRFVYDEIPAARVFSDLERTADAEGFQIFRRDAPTDAFGAWLAQRPNDAGADSALLARWEVQDVTVFDPAGNTRPAEAVASCGVLDDAPSDDLPWLLDEMAAAARNLVHVAVGCDASALSLRAMGVPAPRPRTAAWWKEQIDAAARRHPEHHWQLVLRGPDDTREIRETGRRTVARPPSVWVLADERPGCTSQSTGLAAALGWHAELKQLRYRPAAAIHNRLAGASRAGLARNAAPLTPPWPELVIAAGRRTAPVAEWIRAQNEGATRLVLLGRKAADAAERSDLAVTTHTAQLFPHPNRLTTVLPLNAVDPERLEEAASRWRARLTSWRSPRIAVLVGGRSGQYDLDVATARRLGEDVAAMARKVGGTVMATTSRRTGRKQTDAFRDALGAEHDLHAWEDGGGENPYLGLLALADLFIVTGDSESMLAEALAIGRPVFIYPLPERPSFAALQRPRAWVLARARARRLGTRGVELPQRGIRYLAARLIDRGFVRPTRDLGALHEELIEGGFAQRFGGPVHWGDARRVTDLDAVASRVRALMGVE